jgi:hypothetical protein
VKALQRSVLKRVFRTSYLKIIKFILLKTLPFAIFLLGLSGQLIQFGTCTAHLGTNMSSQKIDDLIILILSLSLGGQAYLSVTSSGRYALANNALSLAKYYIYSYLKISPYEAM